MVVCHDLDLNSGPHVCGPPSFNLHILQMCLLLFIISNITVVKIKKIFLISGVCMGYECSISLKTPCEVLEASAGFSREINVTTTDTQTVEEQVVWEVDSQIKVCDW